VSLERCAERTLFREPPDLAVAGLATRQHGVVTLAQLRAAGLDRFAIRRRVAQGRLHRLHCGVYAVGHGALSWEGECLAAVWASGPRAALSHLSAAKLCEVSRFFAPLIAVVTVTQHRPRGVCVHQTARLHPRDLTEHRHVPVTSMARTLVDLTDVLTAHQLANVIHEAAFRGRFVESATRDAMARANGRHNLDVLERALALHRDGSAGTKSGLEDVFLARLPQWTEEPRVNTSLLGIEVDFHWPRHALVVEVDGSGHGRARTQREDAEKQRKLEEAGYAVIRVTDPASDMAHVELSLTRRQ
jgi:hypothetical protein